jgi:hypothetical protein
VWKLFPQPNDLAAGVNESQSITKERKHMSIETIIIILVVLLLLGGGGFYLRGRR